MQDRTSANPKKSSCNARPDHTLGHSRQIDTASAVAACPLRAESRQVGRHLAKPALCQSRPNAPQQKNPLFDHLVGAAEQREREGKAERLGGLEVEDQFDFCGLLNR
jgi:hypothetical protein